ncbi:MAG TPA: DUF6152 family protein, partial [Bryobacteraceae bacterium]|nr:DUF6152 family protein [Bryobacteraceae bacterium]
MKWKLWLVVVAGACLPGTLPVQAHHSFAAEYDSAQLITLKGTISKVEWTNPHIYVYLDVKDAGGKVTTWALEGY